VKEVYLNSKEGFSFPLKAGYDQLRRTLDDETKITLAGLPDADAEVLEPLQEEDPEPEGNLGQADLEAEADLERGGF